MAFAAQDQASSALLDTATCEEAAVMVSRAAKLNGIETSLPDSEVRDTLAQFADHTASSDWARSSLAL